MRLIQVGAACGGGSGLCRPRIPIFMVPSNGPKFVGRESMFFCLLASLLRGCNSF